MRKNVIDARRMLSLFCYMTVAPSRCGLLHIAAVDTAQRKLPTLRNFLLDITVSKVSKGRYLRFIRFSPVRSLDSGKGHESIFKHHGEVEYS